MQCLSNDSIIYSFISRKTPPQKDREAERRSNANNNKPLKLIYNSKKDGLRKRLVKPHLTENSLMSKSVHSTSQKISTDQYVEVTTENISRSSIPAISIIGESYTTQSNDQKLFNLTDHLNETTLSPQDLHKQKEFHRKFEKLQLEQIKAHKAYQRKRIELKRKHTQMLEYIPMNIALLKQPQSKIAVSVTPVFTSAPTSAAPRRRENHEIPKSFINSEPKVVIKRGPYYRTSDQYKHKVNKTKLTNILPPYMYRYYQTTKNTKTSTSTPQITTISEETPHKPPASSSPVSTSTLSSTTVRATTLAPQIISSLPLISSPSATSGFSARSQLLASQATSVPNGNKPVSRSGDEGKSQLLLNIWN